MFSNFIEIKFYLQQIEKQYSIPHNPINVTALSFPSEADFRIISHWSIILRISIRASINKGYFILSGVPKIKLQAY